MIEERKYTLLFAATDLYSLSSVGLTVVVTLSSFFIVASRVRLSLNDLTFSPVSPTVVD